MLLLGVFSLTWLAINLSKETTMHGQVMETIDGEPVKVASSQMEIDARGVLLDGYLDCPEPPTGLITRVD